METQNNNPSTKIPTVDELINYDIENLLKEFENSSKAYYYLTCLAYSKMGNFFRSADSWHENPNGDIYIEPLIPKSSEKTIDFDNIYYDSSFLSYENLLYALNRLKNTIESIPQNSTVKEKATEEQMNFFKERKEVFMAEKVDSSPLEFPIYSKAKEAINKICITEENPQEAINKKFETNYEETYQEFRNYTSTIYHVYFNFQHYYTHIYIKYLKSLIPDDEDIENITTS